MGMLQVADGLPTIMPGSGINGKTIQPIFEQLKPLEIHLSGGRWVPSDAYQKEDLGMGEWAIWKTDTEKVEAVVNACNDAK
jgi:copper homeostasis protein CutC